MATAMTRREVEVRDIIKSKNAIIKLATDGDSAKASALSNSLMQVGSDYKLKNCSVDSVMTVAMNIVQSGLNPNPLFGQAYVVPFRTKNGEMAQLQIGYKGYIALGYRNGWHFKARPVYKCDDFDITYDGFEDKVWVKPNFEKRQEEDAEWIFNNLVGVNVYAKDSQGFEYVEHVSKGKLEKLRLKSQNQKNSDKLEHIWAEWAEEMYKAKALKYVITRLPITENIVMAIAEEDKPFRQIENKTKPIKSGGMQDINKHNESAEVADFEIIDEEPINQSQFEKQLISLGLNDNEVKEFMNSYNINSAMEDVFLNDIAGLEEMVKGFIQRKESA